MNRAITILLVLFSFSGQSQTDSIVNQEFDVLRIAVKHAPPFVRVDQTGVHGPIIDFWENMDHELGWSTEYVVFDDIQSIINAVEKGEVHMSVNPVTVTSERLTKVDFSQPFFITDTAITQLKSNDYLQFISRLFTWKFFSAILGLALIILGFGFVVWLLEHRKNKDFRKGVKGIADGFWWSAVTMTTVGYGDKSPKTGMGRIVAFVWMIGAVVGISSLTAGIASSLTTSNLESQIHSVRDLKAYRIVTIANTSTSAYLERFDVSFTAVSNIDKAFETLAAGDADYFVFDRVMTNSAMMESPLQEELEVLSLGLRTDYYSFPINKEMDLQESIDIALVRNLNRVDWIAIKEFYQLK